MLYWDSKDSKVASPGIIVRTGRKWRTQEGLDAVESLLRHRALMGTVATGCAGLEAFTQPYHKKAHGKDTCQRVLK